MTIEIIEHETLAEAKTPTYHGWLRLKKTNGRGDKYGRHVLKEKNSVKPVYVKPGDIFKSEIDLTKDVNIGDKFEHCPFNLIPGAKVKIDKPAAYENVSEAFECPEGFSVWKSKGKFFIHEGEEVAYSKLSKSDCREALETCSTDGNVATD